MKALCRVLALLAVLTGIDAASAVDAQSWFGLYDGNGTFRADAPVRIAVSAPYESEVEGALVPLSLEDVLGIVKESPYRAVPPALLRDRRAIATVRTRIVPASQKDGNHQVQFGRQPPGFYAFRLRVGGEFAGARLLNVTTVGLVTSDTGGSLTVYALDLGTLHARHDVTFDRYAQNGERRDTERADSDGLAAYDAANGTDIVFAHGDDGSLAFAYLPYSFRQPGNPAAGYVHTDRPIYRPGDRVQYRALVRDGIPGSYAVPAGEVSLVIRDPEWKNVVTAKVRLDAFGALAGDLPLADDAKLGTYQIGVTGASTYYIATTSFAVEAYKKPEYVIDVAAPRYVVGGDAGRFGVAARYFFGRPAAGMRLHYRATFAAGNAWWRRGSPFRFGGYEPPSVATPRDERGRNVSTVGWIWVAAEHYARPYAFTTVSVVPQKAAYAPGERASVLVTSPRGDVDALVRVTGGEHDRITVRRLASQTTVLEIDPPRGVPHYRVSVLVPAPEGASIGYAELAVVPAPHRLRVSIVPAKATYLPGETARFAIHVEDSSGRGVPAQVGLGVIDDAVFALRRSASSDPFDAFYASSGPYRGSTWSWNALGQMNAPLMRIGAVQSRSSTGAFVPQQTADVYNIGASQQQPSFEALRSDFRDTAYWSPAVTTGSDGRATVVFRWPDSLTSYTANGVAATQGSDFGQGAGAALVTKDFLVRLGAPRFLRRGDAARITGVAQGTPRAKTARLRFSAPELGVADSTTTARFDSNASANVHWDVRGGELGNPLLRLAGASGALTDGMQVALPIESALSAQHLRAAGKLPAETSVELALPRGGDAGALRIDLAPSALAQLIADVRLLQVYPYYCVEQTMSAALPAVFVERVRKRVTLPPTSSARRSSTGRLAAGGRRR